MTNFRLATVFWAACLAGAMAAGGCASSSKSNATGEKGGSVGGSVNRAASKTSEGFSDAALTPLEDLNLRRVPIPPLLDAIASPYEPVKDRSCKGIGAEVAALTNILGADVDVPEPTEDMKDKAADGAAKLALNEVSDVAGGFIPYRSIVRFATGASEHERKLRAAYERGMRKRAYLKGIGASLGCAPPAAPSPYVPAKAPEIEYRTP